MDDTLKFHTISAAVLLCMSGASSALSLGQVSGSTTVGRSLELSAPIQFDDASGNGSGCVSAEVMYGDRPVDSARVQVNVSPDSTRQLLVARISSSMAVDEPVVTLLLRAGCGRQTATRRYVLLAEAPREDSIALAASSVLKFGNVPTGDSRASLGRRPDRTAATGPEISTRTAGYGAPLRAGVDRPIAPMSARGGTPRGRLQLATWDPATQLPFGLRTSSELRTVPAVDPAHRAAATSLWRALNAQPQDLLRSSERLRSLEGELTSLRGVATRHRNEISSAREALQNAKSQRQTHLLLAAVLAVLAGSAAAFLWHRTRRSTASAAHSSWYPSEHADGDLWVDDRLEPATFTAQPEAKTTATGAGTGTATGTATAPMPPAPEVVVPLIAVPPAVPVASRTAGPVWDPVATRHRDVVPDAPMLTPLEFSLPEAPPAPSPIAQPDQSVGLRVDSLQGAQQQAEFFGSLGQYDEAIAVLSEYIDAVGEKPVLAYLELLRIYHGIGKRVEYEELQSQFRKTFGADVAGFSEFREETRELEAYPVAMMRVTSSWATADGQDTIEDLLFKRPSTPRDLMSLQAYRDLLWLYGLGHDIVHSNQSPAGLQLLGDSGLPNNHFILPWAVGQEEGPPELSLESLRSIDVAPELQAFGVDIDLTSMPTESVQHSWRDEATGPQSMPGALAIQSVVPDLPDSFDDVMDGQTRR